MKRVPIPVFLLVILVSTLGGIFGAIALSPWFSWTGNALSDLGVYESEFIAAILFNTGLMSGGLMISLLAIRIHGLCSSSVIARLGTATLCSAGLTLFAIGFFPEVYEPYHLVAAVSFFLLIPTSSFLFGVEVRSNSIGFAFYSFALPFVSIIAWGVPYYTGWAIPEIISCIAGWVWIILLGLHYDKKPELNRSPREK